MGMSLGLTYDRKSIPCGAQNVRGDICSAPTEVERRPHCGGKELFMEKYRYEFVVPNDMMDIHLEFSVGQPNSGFNKHYHDWIEIVYLINGDLEVSVNDSIRSLAKNEFIVVNPMTIHSTWCRNGNTAILLQIPVSFLERFMPEIREYVIDIDMNSEDPRVRTKLGNIRNTLQNLWVAYQFEAEGYIFRCYSLILELIYILVHSFSRRVPNKELRKNQRNLERIQHIINYVREHYTEQISIRDIASEVGLNEIYFSRFFKENMGLTFLEYVNTVRLEKIYVDLLNTNRSIKDIQETHGFYNDKVFRRMFREIYGCAPHEARSKKLD